MVIVVAKKLVNDFDSDSSVFAPFLKKIFNHLSDPAVKIFTFLDSDFDLGI